MLHFVNRTKKDFKLKLTDNNILCLYDTDTNKCWKIASLPDEAHDDMYDKVVHKLEETNGEFNIDANRTSKFYVPVPQSTVLYELPENFVNGHDVAMMVMYSLDNGLDKASYRHPKSVVLVIDNCDRDPIEVEYDDAEMNELVRGDDYMRAPVFIGAVITNADADVRITAIFVNLSKWDNVPENTFIRISDDIKLRVSVIEKTVDDRIHRINALIRCDSDGNPIQDKKKNFNNRGKSQQKQQQNHRSNQNNRRTRGRSKMSSLTNGIETIDNG